MIANRFSLLKIAGRALMTGAVIALPLGMIAEKKNAANTDILFQAAGNQVLVGDGDGCGADAGGLIQAAVIAVAEQVALETAAAMEMAVAKTVAA